MLGTSITLYASKNCLSFVGTMVGGDGGGTTSGGARGGGGGFTNIATVIAHVGAEYKFAVGSGGAGGISYSTPSVNVRDATSGGDTSFLTYIAGGGGAGQNGISSSETDISCLGRAGGSGTVKDPMGGGLAWPNVETFGTAGIPGMTGFYMSKTSTRSVSGSGGMGAYGDHDDQLSRWEGGTPGGGDGAFLEYTLGISGTTIYNAESGKVIGGGGNRGRFGANGSIGLRISLRG